MDSTLARPAASYPLEKKRPFVRLGSYENTTTSTLVVVSLFGRNPPAFSCG